MSKVFTWKVQLVYLFCALVLGVITWTFTTDTIYGELISSPRIHAIASLMIGLVIFFTFIGTVTVLPDIKWVAHAAIIFIMFFSLLLPYIGAMGESSIYAKEVATNYSCPVTWEGPKATLTCEYGKVEKIVSVIPMEYHMRPLPTSGTCKYKKYATGKFEDCKIFNEISSN